MRISMAVLALCAVGCGSDSPMTEETFVNGYIDITCDKMVECLGAALMEAEGFGEDAGECAVILAAQGSDTGSNTCGGEWDAGMASTCLDEYEALSCDEIMGGETPDACYLVCT